MMEKNGDTVSVPYWGLDFLIILERCTIMNLHCFRPLLGIRFFDKFEGFIERLSSRFRPLLGIRFFDLVRMRQEDTQETSFPSPIGD